MSKKNPTPKNSKAVLANPKVATEGSKTLIDYALCRKCAVSIPYKGIATIKRNAPESLTDFLHRLQNECFIASKLFQSLENGLGAETVGETYGDGADLFQECFAFLWEKRGHYLEEVIELDQKGNPVSILKACFKYLNEYIRSMRNTARRAVSLDERFLAKELVLLPDWDTEITYGDLPEIEDIIQSLGLNDRQRQVVSAKFATEGSTTKEVADAVGIKTGLVYKSLQQVSTKLILQRPKTLLSVLRLTYRQKSILRLRLKMLGESAKFDDIFDIGEKDLRRMARIFGKSVLVDMQSISVDEIAETLSLIREKARQFFPKH